MCPETASRLLGIVIENVERGAFEIPFRLDRASRAIRTLLRRYASVPMDFADACLVQMADELDTGRILTLDDDFAIYRWRRSRAFDRLLPPGDDVSRRRIGLVCGRSARSHTLLVCAPMRS